MWVKIFLNKLLVYTMYVLPFILVSKALYICIHENNFTLINFNQEFISHIPFIGASLVKWIWSLSADSSLLNNQINGELFFIGGLASSFAWSLKTLFVEILGIPLTLNMDNSGAGDSSKVPEEASGVASGSGASSGSDSEGGAPLASGSGSGSGTAEASGSTERVITYSDYEYDSVSEYNPDDYNGEDYTEIFKKEQALAEAASKESDVSKTINSDNFKENIKKLDTDKLEEVLNTIDYMKDNYYATKVPSAKEQIGILEIKEMQCIDEIQARMAEGQDKGKEVDRGENNLKEEDINENNSNDKGKEVSKDENNFKDK
jgi:hypothetical protein